MAHLEDPSPSADMLARHPHLAPRTCFPKLTRAALAAKNLRCELRRAYPNLAISVVSEHFSMGNAIRVRVDVFPEDGLDDFGLSNLRQHVDYITQSFVYGHIENSAYPNARAFIDAFGGAKFGTVSCDWASPAQIAVRRQKVLSKTVAEPVKLRRGPRL